MPSVALDVYEVIGHTQLGIVINFAETHVPRAVKDLNLTLSCTFV